MLVRSFALLAAMILIAAAPAHAQTAGTLLFGPLTFRLPNGKPVERERQFSLPDRTFGAYLMRIEVEPANALSSLSIALNGARLAGLADFGGAASLDRPISLLARNTVALEADGERGAEIRISVFTLLMPRPVAVSPSALGVTIGQPGGTLSATLSPTPTAPGVLGIVAANPAVASVPVSVAFAAGQSTVPVPVAGVASGSTTIEVAANGGTASASVNVNAPPQVSLTAPANNALFNAPASFALAAAANDPDGSVTRVDFYQGTTLIGSAPGAPYAAAVNNLAAGTHGFTAVAVDNAGASSTSAALNVTVNALPTISISSPTQAATFAAPASIPIVISAADEDGTVNRVEVFADGSLITTLTSAPYSFSWTGVPVGNYILTAKTFDNNNAEAVSSSVALTVEARGGKLYFIHVDHLNTPRLVTDTSGKAVWQWDQREPYGNNPPDDNPVGLGTFDFPLRFPGQYWDKEDSHAYNFYRDFDPSSGRYIQSDPIGIAGGLNTYAYVNGRPVDGSDFFGLERTCGTGLGQRITPNLVFAECCGEHDDCYDDCKNLPSKDSCDREFNNCTLRQCSNRWIATRFACEYFAVVYATSMRGYTAWDAFNNARKNCTCKP